MLMDQLFRQHLILVNLWFGYCFLHSLLASSFIKKSAEYGLGKSYKYYRISYSFFAAVSLGFVLMYQFTIESPVLFSLLIIKVLGLALFVLPGMVIMGFCIRKYFYELSGVQAIINKPIHITLQQTGLHKYVRHPLYSGTLLFIWGLFLTMPLLAHLLACIILTLYVLVGIKLEEEKLKVEFGESYIAYSRSVKKLIPGIL